MSTWVEPSGFIVQMSLFFTNAILPFAPGNEACAGAANTLSANATMKKNGRRLLISPPGWWATRVYPPRPNPHKGREVQRCRHGESNSDFSLERAASWPLDDGGLLESPRILGERPHGAGYTSFCPHNGVWA